MGSNSRQSELSLYAGLTRRDVLRYAGYGSMAAFLAACGGNNQSGQAATTARGGQHTVGSNASDPAPKQGLATINDAFRKAAELPPLKGVMSVLENEWASSRIVGDPHSSIVDLPLTAIQGELLSLAAWYDNEMGYATRLAETAALIAERAVVVGV